MGTTTENRERQGGNRPEPRRARVLKCEAELDLVLEAAAVTRYPLRNRLVVLLAFEGGLRMSEIARLTHADIFDNKRRPRQNLVLHEEISKRTPGRVIALSIRPRLWATLKAFAARSGKREASQPLVASERGCALGEDALRYLLYRLFRHAGLDGCSSFSGRRSFIHQTISEAPLRGRSLRQAFQASGLASLGAAEPYADAPPARRRPGRQLDLFA